MAEKQSEKKNYKVIERRCRVVIDVPIYITEITPESVAGSFTPDESDDGLPWEWAERQSRLLHRLLNDEEVLDEYLRGVAADDLALLLQNDRIGVLGEDGAEQLFENVYAGMESADARFFEEAKKDGVLFDNAKLVDEAFVTDWKGAELAGLMVIK